jgi:hypothetical protein
MSDQEKKPYNKTQAWDEAELRGLNEIFISKVFKKLV